MTARACFTRSRNRLPPVSKSPRRVFRVVVFDLFGTVLTDRATSATRATAEKRGEAWLESFDLRGHYLEEFADRVGSLRRKADGIDRARALLEAAEA